jgi:L-arabinokinase
MTIVFYSSGHGFGHASRDLEVINAIGAQAPQVRLILRTSVPRWFLEVSRQVPVELQELETDTGIAQIDSLTLDEHATALRAAAFYAGFTDRVSEEAAHLEREGVNLVVGDIPPLAFAAAAAAGVPSVALGNFTWDWIYAIYPQFHSAAPGVLPLIEEAYSRARLALRLPFHGGFDSVQRDRVQDLPLVARRSRRAPSETRGALGVDSTSPLVLASFGGHGVTLPFADIAREGGFTLIVTDHELPDPPPAGHPGIRWFRRNELTSRGVRYEDLVAASNVVVAKLGYGIVSECVAHGTALLYTSRGTFREHDVFVAELPSVLRCRYISQEDLRVGRWEEAVQQLLDQPAPPQRMPTNGAEVAAQVILRTAGA